jgi:hypothetical protein
MHDLLVPPEQLAFLARLRGARVRQLVWDLNAIYFVLDDATVKVEAQSDRPPGAVAEEFDEASYLVVAPDPHAGPFYDAGEEEYWYRVVGRDITIEQIEVVRAYVGIPGAFFLAPGQAPPMPATVAPVDCGLLITTAAGVLPAVQLGLSFGFMHWPEQRWYSRAEVEQELAGRYEIFSVPDAASIARAG